MRTLSIITSRPIVAALYLLTLFLWCAVFFYLVPAATGGWFASTVSIVFGTLGSVPMIVIGIGAVWRTVRGLPIHIQESGICPHCGRPYESASADS